MVRITNSYTRPDAPEIAEEQSFAKANGYRHRTFRENGRVQSVLTKPHAKDSEAARKALGDHRTDERAKAHLGLV